MADSLISFSQTYDDSFIDGKRMNKRKMLGVVVTIIGVILTAGAAGQVDTYGVVAPVTMSLIAIIGVWIFFSGKKAGTPPAGGPRPQA